ESVPLYLPDALPISARRLQRPGQPGSLVRVDDHGPIGPGTNGHVEFSIAVHVAHGESTYKQYRVDVMDHERSRSLLRPHDNVVVVDEDHVEEAVAVDVGPGEVYDRAGDVFRISPDEGSHARGRGHAVAEDGGDAVARAAGPDRGREDDLNLLAREKVGSWRYDRGRAVPGIRLAREAPPALAS